MNIKTKHSVTAKKFQVKKAVQKNIRTADFYNFHFVDVSPSSSQCS